MIDMMNLSGRRLLNMKTVSFPKLKVNNGFLTAECHDISVERKSLKRKVYKKILAKIVKEALGKVNENLEIFFRGSLWDPSHHTTKEMMDVTSSVIKSAVGHAMQQILLSSAWGLSRVTEIFCHQPTKDRIVEYLRALARDTNVPESDFFIRDGKDRLHLLLHRLTREQLEDLRMWYEDKFGGHWIKYLYVVNLPDRPAPFLQRGYHMNFMLEFEGAKGPETFAFANFMLMVTFTQPFVEWSKWQKSLTDIGADRVALMLLRTYEESNEDQLENITVEKLELPESMIPKVQESYQLIKSKTDMVYRYHESHNLGALAFDTMQPDEHGFNYLDFVFQKLGEDHGYLVQLRY